MAITPRLSLAAALLAGAATFSLAAAGGVATVPVAAPTVSSATQVVATGLAGARDELGVLVRGAR